MATLVHPVETVDLPVAASRLHRIRDRGQILAHVAVWDILA